MPREFYSSIATKMPVTLANGATVWSESADKPDSLYREEVYVA